jgi:uncharacterized membrane protein YidH (DUF202 family)
MTIYSRVTAKISQSIVALQVFLPSIVLAQTGNGAALAKSFVGKINDAILFPLISLMMGVAMLVFLYGAFEYIMNADNDAAREKGRSHLLWGIVGLLVMVCAIAILSIAANTFGLGGNLEQSLPTSSY